MTATFQELVNAVDQLLNLTATRTALQLNSLTRERAFEAYVYLFRPAGCPTGRWNSRNQGGQHWDKSQSCLYSEGRLDK